MKFKSPGAQDSLAEWFYHSSKAQKKAQGHEKNQESESLSRFFIPGWKANSVFTRSTLLVKQGLDKLCQDAVSRIVSNENFTPSLKRNIYQEFLSFEASMNKVHSDLPFETFWYEFTREDLCSHENQVCLFREIYAFRLASLYLTKLKFLSTLAEKLELELNERNLLFPNSLLKRIFRPGSSTELHCESLSKNLYSWYLPSSELGSLLVHMNKDLNELSISQIMKLSTFNDINNSKKLLKFHDKSFSHTFSHHDFGKLLNTLSVFLPIWLEEEKFQYPKPVASELPEILNISFAGDYLSSLCQSHWLAQSMNMEFDWSEILCPNFLGDEFENGAFLKLSHELHFLIFLIKFSKKKGYQTKRMVCDILKHKYRSIKKSPSQFPLFQAACEPGDMVNDRVVLSLINLPAKNAHHYITQQILSKKDELNTHGYLLVLTNQQMFVPSLAHKIEKISKDFEFKCVLDLQSLSGKGEVPHYIYVLKKRSHQVQFTPSKQEQNLGLNNFEISPSSSSIAHFKFSGELNHFRKFEYLPSGLYHFFKEVAAHNLAYYENDLSEGIKLEVHKDALINGKLLSLSSTSSSQITHPNFFRQLTSVCLPLGQMITIKEKRKSHPQSPQGQLFHQANNNAPYYLVVGHQNKKINHLELIYPDQLTNKKATLGEAYYQYYEITPKVSHFDIDLINQFFLTELGNQLIQLTHHSLASNLKAILNTLLLPQFLFKVQGEASHHSLSYLVDELIEGEHSSDEVFAEKLNQSLTLFSEEVSASPSSALSELLSMRKSLNTRFESIEHFSSENSSDYFQHQAFIETLLSLPKMNLYPNNDIYLELTCSESESYQKVDQLKIEDSESGSKLVLYCGSQTLAAFYSTQEMIEFISFILSSVESSDLHFILHNLQIPKAEDLSLLVSKFKEKNRRLQKSIQEIENLFQKSMIELVINS